MIDYHQGQLYIEACAATQLAEHYSTPLYVYSAAILRRQCLAYAALQAPFRITSHYAVKANANLALLRIIHSHGLGFDVVSGGELERCLRLGVQPGQIVYSGVGKTRSELAEAMRHPIGCINIESAQECEQVIELAAAQPHTQQLALRVNPEIAVATHPYIATALATSKFGVSMGEADRLAACLSRARHCRLVGITCHLGSMIESLDPLIEACRQLLALIARLGSTAAITRLGLGGGLAVRYKDEQQPAPQQLVDRLIPLIRDTGLELSLEPGRSIVAQAGLCLTRVEYLKHTSERHFAVVDAAMNDLPRPALYQAWHEVRHTREHSNGQPGCYEVVGPVCETGDFIGHQRQLGLARGDVLAVMTTGAYNASMASNYNCRMRAASVLVEGDSARCIERRETLDDHLARELEPEPEPEPGTEATQPEPAPTKPKPKPKSGLEPEAMDLPAMPDWPDRAGQSTQPGQRQSAQPGQQASPAPPAASHQLHQPALPNQPAGSNRSNQLNHPAQPNQPGGPDAQDLLHGQIGQAGQIAPATPGKPL